MTYLIYTCIVIITLWVLCTPLLLWLYSYQSFPWEYVARRYVLLWMLLWACMTLPLLLQWQSFQFLLEALFSSLYMWNLFFAFIWLSSVVVWFHILLYSIFFLLSLLMKEKPKAYYFIGSAWVMLVCSAVMVSFYWIFSFLWLGQASLSGGGKMIFWIVYSSVLTLAWYYLMVSLLEEFSKYIAHLSQSHRSDYWKSFLRFVLFSLSLALGFSFFENIVYTYVFYTQNGISASLIYIAFFRSLFSLSLHLLCALLFSLGMWYFWKYSTSKNYQIFLKKWYFFLLLWSLFSHAFFNLSLSFGYIWVVLLSVFGLYALVAYIVPRFHDQNVL